jgi:hypothetical protein
LGHDIQLCSQCGFQSNANGPAQLLFIDTTNFLFFLTIKSYVSQLKNPLSLYKIADEEEEKNKPHTQQH